MTYALHPSQPISYTCERCGATITDDQAGGMFVRPNQVRHENYHADIDRGLRELTWQLVHALALPEADADRLYDAVGVDPSS